MTGRDGKTYKTVQIGDQTWMAENMADQSDDVTCYANTDADPDFVEKYGCLYNWYDAMKVCPEGWRIAAGFLRDQAAPLQLSGVGTISNNITYSGTAEHAAVWTSVTTTMYIGTGAEYFNGTDSQWSTGVGKKESTLAAVRCMQ
jgi:hypothetical protein